MKGADIVTVIVIIVIAVLLGLGVLGGILAVEADAAHNNAGEMITIYSDAYYVVSALVDGETGVNYMVVLRRGETATVTPRLNADGSLYVTK